MQGRLSRLLTFGDPEYFRSEAVNIVCLLFKHLQGRDQRCNVAIVNTWALILELNLSFNCEVSAPAYIGDYKTPDIESRPRWHMSMV